MRERGCHRHDLMQGVGPEQQPAVARELEHHDDLQPRPAARMIAAPGRGPVFVGEAMHDEEHSLVEAPQDEVPRRAMPQTAEDHCQQQIAVRPERAVAIAAEREVQVAAQPVRQADVPPAPEVLWTDGEVRQVEIQRQLEAHQLCHAAGDVRVAGEIAIDLERKRDGRAQGVEARLRRCVESGVDERREPISDHDLLPQSPDHQVNAVDDLLAADTARALDLRQQVDGPHDRAGHEVREETDEQREVPEIPRRLELAPVDVDRVAHRLEREERDADGQHDGEHVRLEGHVQRVQQVLHAAYEEVEILEEAEHREVAGHADRENPLAHRLRRAPLLQPLQVRGHEEVHDHRDEQKRQETPVPARVEEQAGGEQPAILPLVAEGVIDGQHDGEEKSKGERVEQHDVSF